MTGFRVNSSFDDSADTKSVAEVFEALFRYVKSETLKPIHGAGRWIVFGLIAALSLSIGVVLGAVGVLRLTQSVVFDDPGSWSWVSYIVATVASGLLLVVVVSRIRKGSLER